MRIASVHREGLASMAPMAGQTDLPFRVLMHELGSAFVYTELVSATGIVRGSRGSLRLVRTLPEERPVGVQLFGADEGELAEAAARVEESGMVDLVDLNMGCPVPKVVDLGAGAALMRDPSKVERLVAAVARRVRIPVTAKIRSGWSDREINAPDVAAAIEAGGGQAVAVHARTRDRRHAGGVDLELIAEVKRRVRIPVLGNGGVRRAEDALGMQAATGCDGVLIGRGAVDHPWIFREIEALRRGAPVPDVTPEDRLALLERHLRLSRELRGDACEAETLRVMRAQLVGYTAGLPGAAELRRSLERFETFVQCLEAFGRVFRDGAARRRDQLASRASGSP